MVVRREEKGEERRDYGRLLLSNLDWLYIGVAEAWPELTLPKRWQGLARTVTGATIRLACIVDSSHGSLIGNKRPCGVSISAATCAQLPPSIFSQQAAKLKKDDSSIANRAYCETRGRTRLTPRCTVSGSSRLGQYSSFYARSL